MHILDLYIFARARHKPQKGMSQMPPLFTSLQRKAAAPVVGTGIALMFAIHRSFNGGTKYRRQAVAN
ncbi:hypothetical protein [Glaciimonas soli]|uniref:hypothetical protein n=1 Tax=Glaciimonas soli TaxID=2590999 RepID=UPI001D175EC7|nr:hypothetical protein [Glaciimonas soli]